MEDRHRAALMVWSWSVESQRAPTEAKSGRLSDKSPGLINLQDSALHTPQHLPIGALNSINPLCHLQLICFHGSCWITGQDVTGAVGWLVFASQPEPWWKVQGCSVVTRWQQSPWQKGAWFGTPLTRTEQTKQWLRYSGIKHIRSNSMCAHKHKYKYSLSHALNTHITSLHSNWCNIILEWHNAQCSTCFCQIRSDQIRSRFV